MRSIGIRVHAEYSGHVHVVSARRIYGCALFVHFTYILYIYYIVAFVDRYHKIAYYR